MELDAVDREFAVLQSHDLAFGCFGSDFEVGWQLFTPNDQRMVTRCVKRVWKIFEDASAMMLHRRSFSMHQTRRGNDLAAEDRANALMAETNAENRRLRSERANDVVADSSVFGPAGPR